MNEHPAGNGTTLLLLQMLAACSLAPIPVFGLIMFFIGGFEELPSLVAAVVLVVLNLLAFGLAEAVGYRTVAIAPGTDAAQAHRSAVSALYLGTLLRLAITATPVFFSLVAAFVVNGSQFWTYWCGASWAAVSMLWHAWPRAAAIRKTERSLDRAGGRSALVAAVGLQPAAHADRFAA
ncbi:hypothetical protein [Janibacter limosus]|uniref:hypothetical protein n=1 Tax=Janibacter limosus TaxID=53458 RepID=UPI00082A14FC|nr:hypothetical protein [Janibacter limosus]